MSTQSGLLQDCSCLTAEGAFKPLVRFWQMIHGNCVEFPVDFKSSIRNNKFLKAKKKLHFLYANYMQMRGLGFGKYDIFPFGHRMGSCAKYKNPPSSLFLGIRVLNCPTSICIVLSRPKFGWALGKRDIMDHKMLTKKMRANDVCLNTKMSFSYLKAAFQGKTSFKILWYEAVHTGLALPPILTTNAHLKSAGNRH